MWEKLLRLYFASVTGQAGLRQANSPRSDVAHSEFSIGLGDFIAFVYGHDRGLEGDELLRVRSILGKDSIKSLSEAAR